MGWLGVRATHQARRGDAGHAAVELALGVAVLMLPVALVVLSFGPWLERRVSADVIAAEAARAVVLSLKHEAGLEVAQTLAGSHGLRFDQVRLGWCGAAARVLPAGAGSCALTRGAVVEVSVEVWVPLIQTPWGAVGGMWVSSSHGEPVDLYRSLP